MAISSIIEPEIVEKTWSQLLSSNDANLVSDRTNLLSANERLFRIFVTLVKTKVSLPTQWNCEAERSDIKQLFNESTLPVFPNLPRVLEYTENYSLA